VPRSPLILILILSLVSVAEHLQAQQGIPSPPNPYSAEERLSPRGRSDWLLARAVRKAMGRRYRPLSAPSERVIEFEVRGPSQVVPLEAIGTTTLQLRLQCTEAERQHLPTCVRFDALELFTIADSAAPTSTLSVVPHTFIGPSIDSLYEVGATPHVEADAGVVARSVAGHVVAAVPWPIPVRTPDGQTP
jgi:hypothetical protein